MYGSPNDAPNDASNDASNTPNDAPNTTNDAPNITNDAPTAKTLDHKKEYYQELSSAKNDDDSAQ